MTNDKGRFEWGRMSCECAHEFMKTEEERYLGPFELNAVFSHCTICDACREKRLAILNTRLAGVDITESSHRP